MSLRRVGVTAVTCAEVAAAVVAYRLRRTPFRLALDHPVPRGASGEAEAVARMARRLGQLLGLSCLEQAGICHGVLRRRGHSIRLRWAVTFQASHPLAHAFLSLADDDAPIDGTRLESHHSVLPESFVLVRQDGTP